MKKNSSFSVTARVTLATLLSTASVFLAAAAVSNLSAKTRRPRLNATSATASVPQTFSGTYDATSVFPCSTPRHHFTFARVSARRGVVVGKRAIVSKRRSEPPSTSNLAFTIKVGDLSVPAPVPRRML
jgi:hypothetical protein